MKSRLRRSAFMLALLTLSILPALPGWSLAINITDPNPVFATSAMNCGAFPNCWDQAYVSTAPINALNHGFDAAFDNWNTFYGNNQWSIINGGSLNATFEVNTFKARITDNNTYGGVEIRMQFDYNGADRGDFFWAQGVFTNDPSDNTHVPKYYMDVNPPAGCMNLAPLYPCQYDDKHFYDFPEREFQDQSIYWNGFAYPVKIDRDKHTLTVYQGISYGFQLWTPEPSTLLMFGTGFLTFASTLRLRFKARE